MINAVITGATKGIGRAIAELFLKNGINIMVCARSESDLKEMKTSLQKAYPASKIWFFVADVRQKSAVLSFAEFIKKQGKSIDILVNNAGIFIPGAISEEPDNALEAMIETNLYSAYHLTRALLPGMMEQKQGHVFNMCSIASQIAYPNGGSYSISKFALLGFSKVLREEMKPYNISVTAILPGATWSNSWAGVDLPEDRLIQANDIAKAVYNAWDISPSAVVEEIVIRPQLGDL